MQPYLISLLGDLVRFPLILVGLIVVAYVLTPLVPLFRGVLDASLLPVWIHDRLHRGHAVMVREARQTIDTAMILFSSYGALNARIKDLWAAREVGIALNAAQDPASIGAAAAAIGRLRTPVQAVTVPPIELARAAFDATIVALQKNSAALPAAHADVDRSRQIAALQADLTRLLEDAETEARHRWDYLAGRYAMLALSNPQATRVGDTRLSVESYSFNVYAVDFDYLWPRLLACFKIGDGMADRVEALQDQVNFAVLLLALTLTVPVVWIPMLAVSGQSVALFLGVVALSTISVRLLYEFVAQAHVAFAAVVRTAIDFYRHDVLAKLKQPPPATLSGERMIWTALRGAAQSSAAFDDLSYRQPPT
jgi:hypothetical protein